MLMRWRRLGFSAGPRVRSSDATAASGARLLGRVPADGPGPDPGGPVPQRRVPRRGTLHRQLRLGGPQGTAPGPRPPADHRAPARVGDLRRPGDPPRGLARAQPGGAQGAGGGCGAAWPAGCSPPCWAAPPDGGPGSGRLRCTRCCPRPSSRWTSWPWAATATPWCPSSRPWPSCCRPRADDPWAWGAPWPWGRPSVSEASSPCSSWWRPPPLLLVWWCVDRRFFLRPGHLACLPTAALFALFIPLVSTSTKLVTKPASQHLFPDGVGGAFAKLGSTLANDLRRSWLYEVEGVAWAGLAGVPGPGGGGGAPAPAAATAGTPGAVLLRLPGHGPGRLRRIGLRAEPGGGRSRHGQPLLHADPALRRRPAALGGPRAGGRPDPTPAGPAPGP